MAENDTPFLQLRHDGSVDSPSIWSVYPNGRIEKLGNGDFDTTSVPDEHDQRFNRVIEFEGEIYTINNGRIWKYNPSTNVWQLETGAAATSRPENFQYGLNVVNITGVPYLYAPQSTSSLTNLSLRRKRSPRFGGTTWEEINQNVAVQEDGVDGMWDNIIFDNKFYLQAKNGPSTLDEVLELNLELTQWSVVPHATPPNDALGSGSDIYGPSAFCAYNGKLYQSLYNTTDSSPGTPGTLYLQEVAGLGTLGSTHALTIVSGLKGYGTEISANVSTDPNYGWNAMFVDSNQDKMYLFSVCRSGQGFNDGWAVFEIEESGGQLRYNKDVGQDVLPEQIAFAKAAVDIESQQRFMSFNTVDESGNQVVILEYNSQPRAAGGGGANSSVNYYRWNGPTTPMSLIGWAPTANWSKPRIRQGEGSHLYSQRSPFSFGFTVTPSGSPATTPGTMSLSTVVYGSGQPIELYFLFNKEGETNLQRADVFSPSSGLADEATKRIIEVRAESSEITCQWRAQSDGVALDELVTIMPVAAVTGVV